VNLTDSQRKAIEHDGRNLQLIACAGSGKTEVIARRVVYLLSPGKGGGLAPRNTASRPLEDFSLCDWRLEARHSVRRRSIGS